MKTKELRKMLAKDLNQKEKEMKVELIKLYSQVATGTQLKNPGQIKQLKRTIAKIKTIRMEAKSKA